MRYARPESRRVPRFAAKDQGKVDFKKTRPPLLLFGGEHDHAVPPVIGRKTWKRYRKAQSVTDYHEVAGADHWLIGSEKWQSVADYTLRWLSEQERRGEVAGEAGDSP